MFSLNLYQQTLCRVKKWCLAYSIKFTDPVYRDLTVDTKYGPITGHRISTGGDDPVEIASYLGIPFAKPPVNQLRWQVRLQSVYVIGRKHKIQIPIDKLYLWWLHLCIETPRARYMDRALFGWHPETSVYTRSRDGTDNTSRLGSVQWRLSLPKSLHPTGEYYESIELLD